MGYALLLILVLFVVLGVPNWGFHSYGYAPSGVGLLLLVLVLVLLFGGR